MEKLNGTKVLIRGNHDIFRLRDYQPYFKDIRGSHKLDNFVLTHIPVHPYCLPRWCEGNIHGHLHSNTLNDPMYFNVSVERSLVIIPITATFIPLRSKMTYGS